MARPSKLTQEVIDKTNAYYLQKISKRECPFIEELAIYELDVHSDTVRNWCKKYENKEERKKLRPAQRRLHEEFFGSIKKLADAQLLYYKIKGLKDGRNAVAIFLMKANHGMIETHKREISGPGGGPVEFKPIEVADV